MPNSPEQVTAFEKQVERSIDLQIDQLRELDSKKSKALQSLKSNILDQIKQEREDDPSTPEKEEKYSADLRLTEDELKSVFEEIKKENSQLFSENGIDSFWEFRSFIGLDSDEITFAHSLQEVTLFGKSVELVLPLGTNEQISKNFTAALKQIEKHEDLKPFITSATKFLPRGGMRIEFSIQRDGKEVKYSATPERVLRVDQEPPTKQIKKWTQTALSRRKLERQLRDTLQEDKTLEDEQRIMIEMMEMRMHKMRDRRGEKFKMPEKYQAMIDQIEALRKQERSLDDLCSVRMLFDEASGAVIREKGDPGYTTDFEYEYLAQDGSVQTRINHYSNKKDSVTEYFPQSDQAQKRTTFHENGSIRRTSEYQEDGDVIAESEYRENGTLKNKKIGNNTDIYDESGTSVVYRRLRQEETGRVTSVMVGTNGESFATLDFMQQQTPEMSDSQYLDYLAKNLDTPQKLHLFFELFMRYVHDDPKKAGADHYTPNLGGTDYWQLAEETINRVKEGKMLGDCDDYAFLAKDILRKQGKIAYVQGIPSHAICIWFEKNPSGNWDAYSMGTFGLDKNGNRYGMSVDQEKEKGYATLEEALNSLMPKYDGVGIGVGQAINYRIKNGKVEILHIPEKGETAWTREIPVDLLPNKKIVDRLVTAQRLTEVSQYAKAITEYELLLQEDPSHSDLYHDGLANTLKKSAKKSGNAESERILLEYAGKYPDRPEYHASLGELYRWELSDDAKAQEHFLLAIEHGCTDASPYIRMAELYKKSGDSKKQIEVLELALSKCSDISAYQHGDLAQAYLDNGEREKAVQTWEEIIRHNPNETYPKIELAKMHHDTDPKKARQMYEKYISENQNNPKYNEAFAEFYGDMLTREMLDHPDKYQGVVRDGRVNTYMINAELFKKHPVLGQIHQRQVEQYEKALQVGSENSNTYLNLIDLYKQQDRQDDVFRLCKQAIEKNPDNTWLQSRIVNVYKEGGKTEEAASIYEEMIKRDPENPENYASLGKLYEYKDEVKAFQNFQLAIEKGSTSQDPYMEVADHYKKEGQFGEQIKTFELALVKVPSYSLNSVAYLYLAEAYLETGRKDKAIQTYESALGKDNRVVEPLTYLYYGHQQNLEKAKQLFFLDTPQKIRNNPANPDHQDRLARFYGMLFDETFKENSSQFDSKYQTGESYNPIRITPEFLTQYPDIALLHSERSKALAKVCGGSESRSYDFEQLANLYNQQGKGELALQALQTAIERFKNDEYKHERLLSKTTGLLLAQGNVEKAVQVFKENKEALRRISDIEIYASGMGATQEIVIKFYDQLLSTATNSLIFSDYCYYLGEHNQSEKLKSIAEEAIRKFPDKKERFEYYLKKEEEK